MQVICRLFLRFDFPWAQLVELDISHFNADLTNIFDMLSRCVCLVKLSLSFFKASSLSQLVGNFPQSGSHHSVTLPYLKHLELSEVLNHIFRPFVVPALTELVMRCDFLPADDIVTMIRRSKCYILELRHRPGNYLHTTTHDLLEAIPHIKEFICAPALIRDEDLRNIGRGFLLPQVEVLHCAVTSPIPYLEMIEAQMALAHRGAEEQGGKLTHAEVQVQENFEEFDKVVERLRQINAENGTFFTLTKVG
ncbi:hypothetical protein H0H81_008789 [Sphagnurus paluster]|uniref:Uncharacterized protein n=1 Tax=Sphagnurus paluster TaxID=117069 RepID=A0A9P7K306_9AGAR|nr:hypothetical protein H0H81_008789 [Sphagnurus paluster]